MFSTGVEKTSFLEFSMRRSHSRCFVRSVSILSLAGSIGFLFRSVAKHFETRWLGEFLRSFGEYSETR